MALQASELYCKLGFKSVVLLLLGHYQIIYYASSIHVIFCVQRMTDMHYMAFIRIKI